MFNKLSLNLSLKILVFFFVCFCCFFKLQCFNFFVNNFDGNRSTQFNGINRHNKIENSSSTYNAKNRHNK